MTVEEQKHTYIIYIFILYYKPVYSLIRVGNQGLQCLTHGKPDR